MRRYHLSLSDARKGRQNGAFKRGRPPARITAAQVEHVLHSVQPAKCDYSFNRRCDKYARDAEADAKLYAWLEHEGKLPPAGEDISLADMAQYRRWQRQTRAAQPSEAQR